MFRTGLAGQKLYGQREDVGQCRKFCSVLRHTDNHLVSERQTCNMTPQGVSLVEDTTMEIDEYLTNARAWFVGKRENFGTNGWDTLVGRKNVGISRVEGASESD